MVSISESELLANIQFWIERRQPLKLAAFLSLNSDISVQLIANAGKGFGVVSTYGKVCSRLPSPWNTIIGHHFRLLDVIQRCDFVEATNVQIDIISIFRSQFLDKGTKASLPMLYALLETLSVVAMAADQDVEKKGGDAEYLETSMNSFRGAFSSCINDSLGSNRASKRWGALKIANIIFKILIRLLKPDLMHKQMANLEHQFGFGESVNLESFGYFHRSDFVTYKYYTAIIAVFDDDYQRADQRFTYAIRQIPPACRKNMILILVYLIPLRISRGLLPSKRLLSTFPELKELYNDLVTSIRKGDLALYERIVQSQNVAPELSSSITITEELFRNDSKRNTQEKLFQQLTELDFRRLKYWMKKGLYDLILSLRWLVVRRMVKQLWKVKGGYALLNAEIQLIFSLYGQHVSPEETRYQMAQLSEMKLMMGNVQAGGVVLSKKEPPFPRITNQLWQSYVARDLWQGS